MRCKQGDLAIIVHSIAGNEGKIVRCLVPLPNQTWKMPDGVIRAPGWVTDTLLTAFTGERHYKILDKNLRPIRPDEGNDETLTWAGKPETITA